MHATRQAILLVALAWWLPGTAAHATTCGSVPLTDSTVRNSDVIARGTVKKRREEVRTEEGVRVFSGVAELAIDDVKRGFAVVGPRVSFAFEYRYDGACTSGATIQEGEYAEVYLVRSASGRPAFQAIHIRYPSEKDERYPRPRRPRDE